MKRKGSFSFREGLVHYVHVAFLDCFFLCLPRNYGLHCHFFLNFGWVVLVLLKRFLVLNISKEPDHPHE